jgi:hypothetical protein
MLDIGDGDIRSSGREAIRSTEEDAVVYVDSGDT